MTKRRKLKVVLRAAADFVWHLKIGDSAMYKVYNADIFDSESRIN